MRRALIPALSALLLAGCATRSGAPAESRHDSGGTPGRTLPSPAHVAGRVISVDLRELAAVVEVPPYEKIPPDFAGKLLIARTDDLQPTARLQASPYLRGRMLGTRILAGRPRVGDEVVFAPSAAP